AGGGLGDWRGGLHGRRRELAQGLGLCRVLLAADDVGEAVANPAVVVGQLLGLHLNRHRRGWGAPGAGAGEPGDRYRGLLACAVEVVGVAHAAESSLAWRALSNQSTNDR